MTTTIGGEQAVWCPFGTVQLVVTWQSPGSILPCRWWYTLCPRANRVTWHTLFRCFNIEGRRIDPMGSWLEGHRAMHASKQAKCTPSTCRSQHRSHFVCLQTGGKAHWTLERSCKLTRNIVWCFGALHRRMCTLQSEHESMHPRYDFQKRY